MEIEDALALLKSSNSKDLAGKIDDKTAVAVLLHDTDLVIDILVASKTLYPDEVSEVLADIIAELRESATITGLSKGSSPAAFLIVGVNRLKNQGMSGGISV